MEPWIIQFAVVSLFGVLAYFLRQKDAQQEKELNSIRAKLDSETKVLWSKHDEDAEKLRSLELRIASEHYVKRELDDKFDRLDRSIKNGLSELGEKFDKLTDAMMAHIAQK